MENISDEHIVDKITAGKLNYLGILFDRYNLQLLNYYYRSTGNLHESNDLTQDVFIKLIKYSHSFKPGTPFKTWLFKIAKNLLNNYYSNKQKYITNRHKIQRPSNDQITEYKQVVEDIRLCNLY